MKLQWVLQKVSVKEETLYMRIKARPAVTAPRRKFSGSQNIIFEGVKLIVKWAFSTAEVEDWSSCLTEMILFSEASMPARKVGHLQLDTCGVDTMSEAQRKPSAVYRFGVISTSPIQVPPNAPVPQCSGTWTELQSSIDQHWKLHLNSDEDVAELGPFNVLSVNRY